MPIISNAIITAYCACVICCGPKSSATKGITASGHLARQGITIAAPRHIPLGTTVSVLNHNYTAQDRTARRFDGRWDIYFTKHKDAKKFGIKTNTIRIYEQHKVNSTRTGSNQGKD